MEIVRIKEFSLEYFRVVQKLTGLLGASVTHFTENYFREILTSENVCLFLLLDEDKVAGMLTVGIYKTPTGSKAWIEDVVVEEEYRGKGLGKMLTHYALSFTKSLGIDLLMLTSNPSRIVANKLYQSLGFEKKETNVYKMDLKGKDYVG